MITTYLALKIGALMATLILPLRMQRRKENKYHIELSDWVVTENGHLENLAEKQAGQHPIKTKR